MLKSYYSFTTRASEANKKFKTPETKIYLQKYIKNVKQQFGKKGPTSLKVSAFIGQNSQILEITI